MTGVHYLSLGDVCRRMKSGELTASEVTESILARIQALDSKLNSFATIMADEARAASSDAVRVAAD